MPILKLEDFNIVSPSPDNFILKLKIDGNEYNYIGSGEHVYQDKDDKSKPTIHKSLITTQLAHSSMFEYDEISTVVTAWDMFDLNDVGITTDADDENNDNLLLMQNSNINPSAKSAIPLHLINSNSVYGFVSAINKESVGVPKVDDDKYFNLEKHDSDPITRYHYRPMAVTLSSVLGLGTQTNFADTFDKLFVFDPTDNNRLSFSPDSLKNWRRYQSNRDKSSYRVTNNFDFGKLLVRTILFPKATLNNEYSTERQYTEVSSPYEYMRKYAWDDQHFYSNGSFIVLNSREDNCFERGTIDNDAIPGTMVTSKYSRRFGDVIAEENEVYPPGKIVLDLSDNTSFVPKTDYNKVSDPEVSASDSDIFENRSTFKQYMPESINRENETTSDTSLMTSKHKANIFDVDIKRFWNSLKSSINSVPSDVKKDVKEMIKKNLYDMIENIRPAHTKLYRVITNEDGDEDDTGTTPVPPPTPPTPPVEKKVTLVFKANGGLYNNALISITRTGKVGITIGDIVEPTRLGYLFDSYDKEVPETFPSSNMTYVAQWNPISYTIIFHSNVEDETHEQTFIYGIKQKLDPNEFENEHHTFIGWSKNQFGTVVHYANEATVLNLATQNVSIDLYAVWNPDTYVARFHINEGTGGNMPDQKFTYGIAQKLRKNKFVRDHYKFINWIANDEIEYNDQDELTLESDIDLSAQWEIEKYKVTFNRNGGLGGEDMPEQEFVYGQSQNLNKNLFEKENYDFVEWIGSDGKKYEDQAEISLTCNLNLYAQWNGGDLAINFHGGADDVQGIMNPQHFSYNDSVKLKLNEYTKRHYVFDKWIDANGMTYANGQTIYNLKDNLDISATWLPGQFTVSFNKNDEEATGSMASVSFIYEDTNAKLPENTFIKQHYDFINWIGSDGNTYQNEQEMSSYTGDDLELSAQWAPSKYYVTFNGNGETSGTMDIQEFTYGIPQRLDQNRFERENYKFVDWTDQNDPPIHYNDGIEVSLTSNLSLQANWSRITSTFTFYRTPDQNSIQENPESSPEMTESPSQSGPLLMQSTPPSQQSQITMIYL